MTVNTSAQLRRGVLSIAAAAIAWGTGGAVAVVLFKSNGLGPISVSFWRFVVAVTALAVLRMSRRAPTAAPAPVPWPAAALAGVCLAVSQAAYFASVDTAGVALGTLITMGTSPVIIALGARYLLGERLSRWRVTAIGIAIIGLFLLTFGPHSTGSNPTLGVALALLSAATYSAVILQARARHGQGAMLPAYVIGMLCLAPFAVVEGAFPDHGNSFGAIGWLVFLGVVPTILAYQWFFAGLATVPAATASVIALLESVTAAAIAVGLLGEHLTAATIAGMAVLLAAVTLMARTSG